MMDEPPLVPCQHCDFQALTPAEMDSHKALNHPSSKLCTVSGCGLSFSTKRELNDHLVNAHQYFRCLDAKCFRVFKQKSRMKMHFVKHGAAIPSNLALTSDSTRAPTLLPQNSSDQIATLADETYRYLLCLQALADAGKSRSEACQQLINELFTGISQDGRLANSASLYIRAIQVAMALTESAAESSPQITPAVLVSSFGGNMRPKGKPLRRHSLSDDPDDTNFICESKKAPAISLTERKRRRDAEAGEIRKGRKVSEEKNAEEKQEPVLRVQVPEVQNVTPAFICIEPPCEQKFASYPELWAHLTEVHYG